MTEHANRTDSSVREGENVPTSGSETTAAQTPRSRRRFLLGAGAAAAVLAGCVGDDGDDAPGDDSDDTPTEDDDSPVTDDSDDAATTDDTVEADDAAGTDDPDTEGFLEDIAWAEQYRMELVSGMFNVRQEVVFHDGDMRMTMEVLDEEEEDEMLWGLAEFYEVDGQTYVVIEGEDCFEGAQQEEGEETITEEEIRDENFDAASRVGTDEIDGDAVTVYEIPGAESMEMDGDLRYYVLDSGYIRRVEIEAQDTVVDFFDWGETDPIEPPDLDCEGGMGPIDDFPDDMPEDFPDDMPEDFPDDYP